MFNTKEIYYGRSLQIENSLRNLYWHTKKNIHVTGSVVKALNVESHLFFLIKDSIVENKHERIKMAAWQVSVNFD